MPKATPNHLPSSGSALTPHLSLSGTSQQHPIANLWYLCLTSSSQSCWFPFTTLFAPSVPEPKAQSHSISGYYTLQTFTIIITIIMQNHNFINFILHRVYCNLVEYCNIVYCGTLCELYYNLCEHQEQWNKPCTKTVSTNSYFTLFMNMWSTLQLRFLSHRM